MNKKILIVIVLLIIGAVWFSIFSTQNTQQPTEEIVKENPTNSPTQVIASDKKTFALEGVPYSFSIKEIKVKQGETVRIEFTNKQGMHDFVLDEFNAKTNVLNQGESEAIEFVADKKGEFEYYCSVNNHRRMGMVGKFIIE